MGREYALVTTGIRSGEGHSINHAKESCIFTLGVFAEFDDFTSDNMNVYAHRPSW